ncbi:MAG: phosphoribosylformylglycinamidine cyclo-ligase [Geminicoccaceae bacterium]|nr:phosphoribosylformylglycinamidine cyclo-ligase [Geminicoccaceae bacterium]MCX8100060.1 phosphoribosylformylglycinamidine cyclo-ligase [Geminicoccaceae bacterium]MDW8369228.1 phosphoribosylformylglycinamidine cyclo-ligase [Geminicoccaceae bacterium]
MHQGSEREQDHERPVEVAQAGDRYREAGVDIAMGNALVERIAPLARSTRRVGSEAGLGGFGALFDLAACGYRDPLLVATTDGVGTKLLLALEADRLEGIGVDLVAMCVNDLVVQGAEPLFFLDYFATGKLELERAEAVLRGVAAGCRAAGCALVGGETAEMPGLYAPGHLDLAGFAVGAVERADVLPRPGIAPGDAILGLASSGVHANGFSLVRLILREQGLAIGDPAPFAPDRSLAEILLEPTRIYVKSALAAVRAGGVQAMAHVTGGGLVENLPRVLPEGVVARLDARRWTLPPVFRWLREAGRLGPFELARTFNAGLGLLLVVEAGRADPLRALLTAAGESVAEVGRIEPGRGRPRVILEGVEEAWAGALPRS